MNRKQYFLFPFITGIFLIGWIACGGSGKQNESAPQDAETTLAVKATEAEEAVILPDMPKTNAQLLQGTWQHEEDKTNFLVFEKHVSDDKQGIRKEIADGMDEWDQASYIIGDSCECDTFGPPMEPEKEKFITCPKDEMCWYIVSVDEDALQLSQIGGRGNILVYKRVTSPPNEK